MPQIFSRLSPICLLTTVALLSPVDALEIINQTGATTHLRVGPQGCCESSIAPQDKITCSLRKKTCEQQSSDNNEPIWVSINGDTPKFTCHIPALGNGVVSVFEWDRTHLGISQKGWACRSYKSDKNGRQKLYAQRPYGYDRKTRNVMFLATGDPQFNYRSPDRNTRSATTLKTLAGLVVKSDFQYRGIIVAGDLTQNARRDEARLYRRSIKVLERYVYDGLGNHDQSDQWPASCNTDPGHKSCPIPTEIMDDIRTRRRETVTSLRADSASVPHYSWDWHDVHFVHLNVYPANDISPSHPVNDPYRALDWLKQDLTRFVKDSKRPVVLIHHYGFDSFSTGKQNWWLETQRKVFWNAIKDYNVVAIITGHRHPDPFTNKNWYVPWPRPAGFTEGPDYINTFIAGAALNGNYLRVTMNDTEFAVERWSIWKSAPLDTKSIPVIEPLNIKTENKRHATR